MMFLAPAVAFGAALAALPVIIHLLNRRRYKRIPWAAMAFLLQAAVRSRKRLRLEEILLMTLRALAVALLAFALARPLFSAAGPSRGAEAVILLDRSASMRYSEGAGTLFDFAKARAHEILSGLGPGGSASLVLFDSAAQFPLGVEPTGDMAEARRAIDEASPGWAGTDYAAAISAAVEASKGFPSRAPTVFVISDFRAGAEDLPPGVASRVKGAVRLVPVTDADGDDVGVTGVAPAGQTFTTSADLLSARVVNSPLPPSATAVSVSIDGAPAEATPVSVDAGSAVNALIRAAALSNAGVHRVVASVPADAYAGDDRAYGVIVRRPLKIAVQAEGQAGLFLSAALDAAPKGSFEIAGAPAAALSRDAGAIDGFIFAGQLPAGDAAKAVAKRVREGAFALVFLGAPAEARGLIAATGVKALDEALKTGGTIAGDFKPALAGAHAATEFIRSSPDLSLATVSIRRLADFAPAGDGVVTPMTVDTPAGKKAFLAFARAGAGAVAVFNAPLSRDAGNFAVSPFFLPLLYETLGVLVGDPSAPLDVSCGSLATVPAGTKSGEAEVDGPQGKLKAALQATPRGFVYAFVPASPGFYRAGGVELAANVPPSEASLRLASRADVTRAFKGALLTGDVAAGVERAARGFEISTQLIIAALVALGLEMGLVYLFKRTA